MSALPGDLTVRDVSVRVGDLALLSGVDFSLKPGELCGLIGPSGAGKTTLIKVLLGLKHPSGGEVSLAGGPVSAAGPVGYVPQDDALHRSLTVRQTLEFAAQLRLPGVDDAARAARIDEVCGQVDLAHRMDVRVKRLSGGQRKRLAVALELLSQPPLLILDEPTSGLDPGLEGKMMARFQQVARAGCAVLVSTHAMQSLDLCDLLLVLVSGHLAWFGPPAEAPEWFRSDDLTGIFRRLELRKPQAWDRAWRGGEVRARVHARPAPAIPARRPARPAAAPAAPAAAPAAPATSPTALTAAAPPSGAAASAPAPESPEAQLAAIKARLARKPREEP